MEQTTEVEQTTFHIAHFPKLSHYSLIVSFAKHPSRGIRTKHSSKMYTVANMCTQFQSYLVEIAMVEDSGRHCPLLWVTLWLPVNIQWPVCFFDVVLAGTARII